MGTVDTSEQQIARLSSLVLLCLEKGVFTPEEWHKMLDQEKRLGAAVRDAKAAFQRPTRGADQVDHPAYYNTGSVECIDAIEAVLEGHLSGMEAFLTGQIIKYVWRWKNKGGQQDLEKAAWYLRRLLDRVRKQPCQAENSEQANTTSAG